MNNKKKWSDLTPAQKAISLLAVFIQMGLLIAAQWDIHHRPNDEFRGSKWIWTAVVFINFIGPISYFIFGRKPDSEFLANIPETEN